MIVRAVMGVMLIWVPLISSAEEAFEEFVLTKVKAARDPRILASVIERSVEIEAHVFACRQQLEREQLPFACFRAIHLGKKWGFYGGFQGVSNDLESRCLKVARATFATSEEGLGELPVRCRFEAERRIRINRYKRGHAN